MSLYEDFIQRYEALDYLVNPEVREQYPKPIDGVCTKCGNKVLEYGGDAIHCWKCGTWWFDENI